MSRYYVIGNAIRDAREERGYGWEARFLDSDQAQEVADRLNKGEEDVYWWEQYDKSEPTKSEWRDISYAFKPGSVQFTASADSGWVDDTVNEEPIDMVNEPPHYKFDNGVEVIDLTEQLNFNCGNAVKYLARAGRKSTDPLEDLRKAEFYVKREIKRVEAVREA